MGVMGRGIWSIWDTKWTYEVNRASKRTHMRPTESAVGALVSYVQVRQHVSLKPPTSKQSVVRRVHSSSLPGISCKTQEARHCRESEKAPLSSWRSVKILLSATAFIMTPTTATTATTATTTTTTTTMTTTTTTATTATATATATSSLATPPRRSEKRSPGRPDCAARRRRPSVVLGGSSNTSVPARPHKHSIQGSSYGMWHVV